MKYCEKCGAKTTDDGSRKKCTVCGKTFYINPKAAVAIILYTHDKKQLVLGVRAKNPQKDSLDSIGGFLDDKEDFETALYRELNEESGLHENDITNLQYLGSAYDAYLWEGEDVPVTSAYFMAELVENAVFKANDDVAELLTIPIVSLHYDAFAWDGLRKMVKKAVQTLEAM